MIQSLLKSYDDILQQNRALLTQFCALGKTKSGKRCYVNAINSVLAMIFYPDLVFKISGQLTTCPTPYTYTSVKLEI